MYSVALLQCVSSIDVLVFLRACDPLMCYCLPFCRFVYHSTHHHRNLQIMQKKYYNVSKLASGSMHPGFFTTRNLMCTFEKENEVLTDLIGNTTYLVKKFIGHEELRNCMLRIPENVKNNNNPPTCRFTKELIPVAQCVHAFICALHMMSQKNAEMEVKGLELHRYNECDAPDRGVFFDAHTTQSATHANGVYNSHTRATDNGHTNPPPHRQCSVCGDTHHYTTGGGLCRVEPYMARIHT